jgi:hypothetical protein
MYDNYGKYTSKVLFSNKITGFLAFVTDWNQFAIGIKIYKHKRYSSYKTSFRLSFAFWYLEFSTRNFER